VEVESDLVRHAAASRSTSTTAAATPAPSSMVVLLEEEEEADKTVPFLVGNVERKEKESTV
jgi:hypothetical protein